MNYLCIYRYADTDIYTHTLIFIKENRKKIPSKWSIKEKVSIKKRGDLDKKRRSDEVMRAGKPQRISIRMMW